MIALTDRLACRMRETRHTSRIRLGVPREGHRQVGRTFPFLPHEPRREGALDTAVDTGDRDTAPLQGCRISHSAS